MRKPLLALLGLALAALTLEAGAANANLTLESGTELNIERYGSGQDRLLWLPTEYGINQEHGRLATELATVGIEVWLADLHTSYFLSPGRSSYTRIPVAEIGTLIGHSVPEKGRLYILSTGRGAALALMALRQWQLTHPGSPQLGGVILLHPNLQNGSPVPGHSPTYLPVAHLTNLPIYIFQPGNSSKRWYLGELVKQLEQGGSSIYAQLLPGAVDGFHVRPETARDRAVAQTLPARLKTALTLLNQVNREPRDAVNMARGEDDFLWEVPPVEEMLQPYPESPVTPSLSLPDLSGITRRLADYRGQVVLLNFWATWCPPCVEEIPSLNRLQERLKGRGFTVLGVDMGESAEAVKAFLDKVPASYPILFDPDDSAVAPWKLRAFPTTFLIDREGRIRYGYFGGLRWDDDEVVSVVQSLL